MKIVACDGKNTGSNTTEWIEEHGFLMPFSVIVHHFLKKSTEETFFLYLFLALPKWLHCLYYQRNPVERSLYLYWGL